MREAARSSPHERTTASCAFVSALGSAPRSLGRRRAAAPAPRPTPRRSRRHGRAIFAAPIQWQRVTAFGQLLVSTTAGLHAVDPDTGAVAWSHADLARLPAEGSRGARGLAARADQRRRSPQNPRTVVLNVFNGELVFDSRAVGLGQISAPRVLPRAGGLLVAGFEVGKLQPMLFAYSIDNGELLWKSDVLDSRDEPGRQSAHGPADVRRDRDGQDRSRAERAARARRRHVPARRDGARHAVRSGDRQRALEDAVCGRHVRVPPDRREARASSTSGPKRSSRPWAPIRRRSSVRRRITKLSGSTTAPRFGSAPCVSSGR